MDNDSKGGERLACPMYFAGRAVIRKEGRNNDLVICSEKRVTPVNF